MKTISILLTCLALSGCTTKKAEALDGKIVKDAQGNYYLVKAGAGDVTFLEKLDLDKYKQF